MLHCSVFESVAHSDRAINAFQRCSETACAQPLEHFVPVRVGPPTGHRGLTAILTQL